MRSIVLALLMLLGCYATTAEVERDLKLRCLENESRCLETCRYADDSDEVGAMACIRLCAATRQACVKEMTP